MVNPLSPKNQTVLALNPNGIVSIQIHHVHRQLHHTIILLTTGTPLSLSFFSHHFVLV
ncbi:hypothetical protein LguiB_013389 [Lonicera macranthoides]